MFQDKAKLVSIFMFFVSCFKLSAIYLFLYFHSFKQTKNTDKLFIIFWAHSSIVLYKIYFLHSRFIVIIIIYLYEVGNFIFSLISYFSKSCLWKCFVYYFNLYYILDHIIINSFFVVVYFFVFIHLTKLLNTKILKKKLNNKNLKR